MQALHAQALLHRHKLRSGAVHLFLFLRRPNRPVKVLPSDKVRQAAPRNPLKGILGLHSGFRLPEALQRRYHIVKEAFDPVARFIAHFQRIGHRVQNPDGLLIGPVLRVGIALSPHRDVVHRRNVDDLRLILRHVELPIFPLKIKRHSSLHPVQDSSPADRGVSYRYYRMPGGPWQGKPCCFLRSGRSLSPCQRGGGTV